MTVYADYAGLVDRMRSADRTAKQISGFSIFSEAADAIERLVAERKEWNATITAERERMDRLVEQITAERDALRKELEAMREIAANRCVIPKVIDELGPLSLWSKSEFEAEVQRRIDAAIREQEEKP